MNAFNRLRSDYISVAFPQSMVEALERLKIKESGNFPGNIYIYDLINQQTLWSNSSAAEILGYGDNDAYEMGSLGLANLIHSDDVERVAEHYQKFFTLHIEEVITIDYRMKRADGDWCWLRSQETPLIVSMEGFPVQVLGVLQNAAHSTCSGPQRHPIVDRPWCEMN